MSSEATNASSERAFEFTAAQKRDLLKLARDTLTAYLAELPLPPAELPGLNDIRAGVFVSLHVKERLRGCIGYVEGLRPLPEALQEIAISAASRDPRFEPLEAEELPVVEIEISVLSPLRQIESPDEIILGKHGLMVRSGYHQGLLLPQVALHNNWNVETFLAHACQKAGLPSEAWKDPETVIYVFDAEVFSETSVSSDATG
ncbi:MAG: AmmeMemoRadiSam system protein A [candidate division KSB1 bacterium]|nr:AmmeMemoRadiSam system protein A [candidate division KSB1 bacterium]MDZ7300862.1 AmmeMemoRadiSam system protein A [candidate division KSB1 bacterium]MDZ7309868.1 AmmeMemoRadiSam system protein A [candidate division KSB1 bacterium]